MAGLNHQVRGELDHSHRLRAARSALLSDHSNQDEKSDLCQESDAHNSDRKERARFFTPQSRSTAPQRYLAIAAL
jgi:hypothetical protein